MKSQPQDSLAFQWGLVSGLLMFSFVALSGIACRLEPFAIAQRALCSAVVTCFVARFAVTTFMTTTKKKR